MSSKVVCKILRLKNNNCRSTLFQEFQKSTGDKAISLSNSSSYANFGLQIFSISSESHIRALFIFELGNRRLATHLHRLLSRFGSYSDIYRGFNLLSIVQINTNLLKICHLQIALPEL